MLRLSCGRLGSFMGLMAAGFQVNSPEASPKDDLETAETYGYRIVDITAHFLGGKQA